MASAPAAVRMATWALVGTRAPSPREFDYERPLDSWARSELRVCTCVGALEPVCA